MVQTAKVRDGDRFASSRSAWLYRSSLGRVFVERIMDTVLVIVTDVVANQPEQMIFIQDNHMVQQLPAAAPDPALRDAILPGTSKAGSDQLAAQVFEHL